MALMVSYWSKSQIIQAIALVYASRLFLSFLSNKKYAYWINFQKVFCCILLLLLKQFTWNHSKIPSKLKLIVCILSKIIKPKMWKNSKQIKQMSCQKGNLSPTPTVSGSMPLWDSIDCPKNTQSLKNHAQEG